MFTYDSIYLYLFSFTFDQYFHRFVNFINLSKHQAWFHICFILYFINSCTIISLSFLCSYFISPFSNFLNWMLSSLIFSLSETLRLSLQLQPICDGMHVIFSIVQLCFLLFIKVSSSLILELFWNIHKISMRWVTIFVSGCFPFLKCYWFLL